MYCREYFSNMQQNLGATVNNCEIAVLDSKPYLKAMSPDILFFFSEQNWIVPLKPAIFDTMPESTAPATI